MAKMTNKELSVKQETDMAKLYGGRRSPSSGAQIQDRGDVRYQVRTGDDLYEHKYDFTGECKVTRAKSMTFHLDTWTKIKEEAQEQDRYPCMFLRFHDPRTGRNVDLVVREVNDDREILGY